MRKLIIIALIALLLVSTVSAKNIVKRAYKLSTEGASQVRVEEHIEEEQPECLGGNVLQSEVSELNSNIFFQEALEYFDDGYHVVELTKAPYMGYKYYTIYKDNNRIKAVSQGFCAHDGYHAYEISVDIEQTMADLDQKYATGELRPVSEGLEILQSIKGLSIYQQSKLIGLGVKYFTENIEWKEEVDNDG